LQGPADQARVVGGSRLSARAKGYPVPRGSEGVGQALAQDELEKREALSRGASYARRGSAQPAAAREEV